MAAAAACSQLGSNVSVAHTWLVMVQLMVGLALGGIGGLRAGGGWNLVIALHAIVGAAIWMLGRAPGAVFLIGSAGTATGLLAYGDTWATGDFVPTWLVAAWIASASLAGLATLRETASSRAATAGALAALALSIGITILKTQRTHDLGAWLPLTFCSLSCMAGLLAISRTRTHDAA